MVYTFFNTIAVNSFHREAGNWSVIGWDWTYYYKYTKNYDYYMLVSTAGKG